MKLMPAACRGTNASDVDADRSLVCYSAWEELVVNFLQRSV